MIVYDLNDFMILNIEGVDYGLDYFFVFNISKNDGMQPLDNYVLDNKSIL